MDASFRTAKFDYHFVPVTPEEAPHLHAVVDELCAKANMPKPKLTLLKSQSHGSPLLDFIMDHMCGALHIDEPRVLLGPKFRALMGHHTADAVVSEEMKAVLAHELGHLKHRDPVLTKMLPLRLSPYLGMIAGLAGVALYEKIHKHAKDARAQGVPEEQVQADMKQAWEKSDVVSAEKPVPEEMKTLVRVAKYAAGGLLGFAVGVGVFVLGHRHIEFRADKFSAELMGDGKPLARALETLRDGLEAGKTPEFKEALAQQSAFAKWLGNLTHPPIAERLKKLESWAR